MRAELFNRQRKVPLDLARLQTVADAACRKCLPYRGRGCAVLDGLELVEVIIVSDRRIAQIHRQFLAQSGPTDVITFEHGEIVVSVTTAVRQSKLENETPDRELARYIVHGMLHLNGHLDETPTDAAEMWRAQEAVLHSLWPRD